MNPDRSGKNPPIDQMEAVETDDEMLDHYRRKNITFDTNLQVDAFQKALMVLPDHAGLDTIRWRKRRETKANRFTSTMIERKSKIPGYYFTRRYPHPCKAIDTPKRNTEHYHEAKNLPFQLKRQDHQSRVRIEILVSSGVDNRFTHNMALKFVNLVSFLAAFSDRWLDT